MRLPFFLTNLSLIREVFFEVLIIGIVSVSLSLGVNLLRSDGLKLFGNEKDPGLAENSSGFKEITIEDAVQKFETEQPLFIDARSSDNYKIAHIKEAVNFPESEFDDRIGEFFSETDPSTEIITYCDGPHCSLARELAKKLYQAGFENVFYLENGLTRWREYSQPVISDADIWR